MSGEREEKSFGSRETLRSGTWTGEEERSFGERETLRSGEWGILEEWEGKRWTAGEEILGRYVVERELGQGGMGVVYGCFDKVGGVRVAVKALPPELSHNSVEMEEVRENFELVYGLSHPNIAGVRTLERDGKGEYFLVMEMAGGESLRKWMRRKWKAGGVGLEEAIPVLRQVASALDYAHSKRVVHRDVKPGNVVIGAQGEVKVLDFGLAAQIRTSLSRASRAYRGTSGTGPYMAPEQWQAQPQDGKADQYALAVMAYEMLAGRLPFESSEPSVLKEAVLHDDAPAILGLPGHAMRALRKAMGKRKEERFGSCGEFVAALGGAGGRRNARGKTLMGWVAALALLGAVAWWGVKLTVRPEGSPQHETVAGETAGEMPALPGKTRLEAASPEEAGQARAGAESRFRTATAGNAEAAERAAEEASADRPEGAPHPTTTITLPGGAEMEMVWCPPGSFMMGSPAGEKRRMDDESQHRVTLTEGFWMAKTEVTQRQWKSVMGNNPSRFKGDDLPVENVRWEEAQEFCREAGLALPTEAQWEYACRAGSEGAYGGTGRLEDMGWYGENGGGKTHPVGRKQPNAWGFHDMHGNVWEWCADWYQKDLGTRAVINPTGPDSGTHRVRRGGRWCSDERYCRSAFRGSLSPDHRGYDLGFRPLRVRP